MPGCVTERVVEPFRMMIHDTSTMDSSLVPVGVLGSWREPSKVPEDPKQEWPLTYTSYDAKRPVSRTTPRGTCVLHTLRSLTCAVLPLRPGPLHRLVLESAAPDAGRKHREGAETVSEYSPSFCGLSPDSSGRLYF